MSQSKKIIAEPNGQEPDDAHWPSKSTSEAKAHAGPEGKARAIRSKKLRACILAVDGFEPAELFEPFFALKNAGIRVEIASRKKGLIHGAGRNLKKMGAGGSARAQKTFEEALAEDFDALILPGGVANADAIRMIEDAQQCVQKANAANKPIGAIGHSAWLLVSAGLARGRTLTSAPSMRDDIRNAGGLWVDAQACSDRNWISSRELADLPAFCESLIAALRGHAKDAEHLPHEPPHEPPHELSRQDIKEPKDPRPKSDQQARDEIAAEDA